MEEETTAYFLSNSNHVVDLHDHPQALRCERDGRGRDEQRLQNIVFKDIRNGAALHVDTSRLETLCVPLAKLSHCTKRVGETRRYRVGAEGEG